MNPRSRRLSEDYRKIREEFAGHRYIRVEALDGLQPPEKYRVTYQLPGVEWNERTEDVAPRHEHVAVIQLQSDYPRAKPKCTLLTPIWHPNFGAYICIGDHWAAGETLVDVIVKIGDMIQYKDYNPKSALNIHAAHWAVKNKDRLPLGNADLVQPEVDVDFEVSFTGTNSDGDDVEISLS